jgi:GNAT superfamily N-acetyltransferase
VRPKKLFKVKSAQATLHIADDKSAKITNVYSQIRGQGHASALFEDIIRFADENRMMLWLEVRRYGKPQSGLSNSGLVTFYQKFGFVIVDDDKNPVMMARRPLLKGDNNEA